MSLDGLRVFIVEDEILLRLDLEDMLVDLGCIIAGSASSADEALALVEDLSFDIGVLDVNLAGVRVDAVADRLAARRIPFIFTTGYGERGRPGQHSATPLLEKPYSSDSLIGLLTQIHKAPSPQPSFTDDKPNGERLV
jgi:CheY-like chemotaxis protein